jgi:hypothetical protein
MKKIVLLLVVFCNALIMQSLPLMRQGHTKGTRTPDVLIDTEVSNGKVLFESNISLENSQFKLTDKNGYVVWIGNLSINSNGEYYIDASNLPNDTYSADLTINGIEYCGNIVI